MIRELRQGFRSLTKSPGFSAVAILMLALGIGASTAIFSVVEAVLLRSLPYPHPQQIMRIWETAPDGHRMPLADPNFDDFRTQNDTFASLAVYADWTSSLSGGSEPVRVDIADVSRGFFESLGVKPFLGREFA
ncbi:MAG TPA: ABC transporter permease, partial [Thermoanaerobaculia bacterium]|nr:ABC transporter permease [Thermoanaerobaculia bacterium]